MHGRATVQKSGLGIIVMQVSRAPGRTPRSNPFVISLKCLTIDQLFYVSLIINNHHLSQASIGGCFLLIFKGLEPKVPAWFLWKSSKSSQSGQTSWRSSENARLPAPYQGFALRAVEGIATSWFKLPTKGIMTFKRKDYHSVWYAWHHRQEKQPTPCCHNGEDVAGHLREDKSSLLDVLWVQWPSGKHNHPTYDIGCQLMDLLVVIVIQLQSLLQIQFLGRHHISIHLCPQPFT